MVNKAQCLYISLWTLVSTVQYVVCRLDMMTGVISFCPNHLRCMTLSSEATEDSKKCMSADCCGPGFM